jgi:predicted RNase H-like HicB family nuclease
VPREIRIRYHYEPDGAWWADSPDLERFTAAAETFAEVRRQAREGAEVFAEEPVMVVEEGVPELVMASAPDQAALRVRVVFEGHYRQLAGPTGPGAIPTVVSPVRPVPEDHLRREGALDSELVVG